MLLQPRNRKFILFIIILSILIRLPYINCPIQPDEGGYLYQAYFWIKKGISFYESRFCNRFAGLPLIYSFIFKIFGSKIYCFRIFLSLWNAISVFLIYLISSFLFNKKVGLISSLIFSYLSSLPTLQGITQKEIFMLPFYLSSIYSYLLFYQSRKKIYLFISGIFLSLATIVYQIGFSLILSLLPFILIKSKEKLKSIFVFLLGILLPLVSTLCFYMNEQGLFYQIVGYRLKTTFIGPIWWVVLRSLYAFSATGFIFLIFAFMIGWYHLNNKKFEKYFVLSLFFSSLFGIIMAGRWFFHYLLLTTPFFSLFLSWCIFYILKQKKIIKILFFAFLFIPFLSYILAAFYTKDFYLSHDKHYNVTLKVANFIKTNSNQNQRIYAFLYHNPSIYFLAERLSAILYIFRSEMLFNPEVLIEIREAIKKKKIDYLLTYDFLYSLKIVKINCECKNIFKSSFSSSFSPFCRDYPIQVSLIKEIFRIIPKYYFQIKKIKFNKKNSVIIWRKR